MAANQGVGKTYMMELTSSVRSLLVVPSGVALAACSKSAPPPAQINLGFATVRSPIPGVVSDRRVSKGNYATDATTVLTRVVSTDPIWFSFDGTDSFLLLIDAERDRASARAALAQSDAAVSDAQISLFKALGGGWEDAPAPLWREPGRPMP